MTLMEVFLSLIAFAAASSAVFAAVGLLSRRKVDQRLQQLQSVLGEDHTLVNADRSSAGRFVRCVAPFVPSPLRPRSDKDLNSVRLRLARAGFTAGAAVEIYVVWRFVAALLTGVLAAGVWLGLSNYGTVKSGMAAGVILSLGFLVPDAILRIRTKARQKQILRTLPEAVDLMVVAIEVGLGLEAVLRNVADEMRGIAPALCAEFDLYNSQLQLGVPKRDALHELGVRAGISELNSFASILIQAERYGSSIAQVLREQSDSIRQRQRLRAEENAQKASVMLILPMVLFIFPGIFVVLVGPAALNLMHDFCNL